MSLVGLENSVVQLNKSNKIFVIFYFLLFVGVLGTIISIDSTLERPYGTINLAPIQLSSLSYSKIVHVDKEIIFDTFADFENYPRILPNNILSVNTISEKPFVYDISLVEKGIKTKLTVEHIIEPYHKQVIKVIDGDAQGTLIVQNFESIGNKTKISIDVNLKTKGILTPFSFLPIHNANNAIETITDVFVYYTKRPYDAYENIVDNLYREILERPADVNGLKKFSELLKNQQITEDEIREFLLNSEEYASKILLSDKKSISELNTETKDTLDEIYNIILRRNADTSGLEYFGSALENGKLSLSEIIKLLLSSDEFDSLPVETRDVNETYMSNESWQIVNQTYYDIYDKYPDKKTIRAYGIFFERGDLTLEEINNLLGK